MLSFSSGGHASTFRSRNPRVTPVGTPRSSIGAPFRKGCVVNGQMTKASKTRVYPSPPPPSLRRRFVDVRLEAVRFYAPTEHEALHARHGRRG